jgi:hypothetical protein
VGTDTQTHKQRRIEKGWRQRDGQRRDGGRETDREKMEAETNAWERWRESHSVSRAKCCCLVGCAYLRTNTRARAHTHTHTHTERERETHTLTPTLTHSLSFLPPHPLREQTPTVKAGIERSSTDHVSSR